MYSEPQVLAGEPTPSAEAALVEWAVSHGARIGKLNLFSYEAGLRGVTALEDITSANSVLLTLPTSLLVTPSGCAEDGELGAVFRNENDLFGRGANDDAVLAVFLAHQRLSGAASFWAPYCAALGDVDALPDWTPGELAGLQDAALAARAEAAGAAQRAAAALIAERLRAYAVFQGRLSSSWVQWGLKHVAARAFGSRIPADVRITLAPVADSFNHAPVESAYRLVIPPSASPRAEGGAERCCSAAEAFAEEDPWAAAEADVAARCAPRAAAAALGGGGGGGGENWSAAGYAPGGYFEVSLTGSGGPAEAGQPAAVLVPAGCPVCISYGRRANADLALCYGFVLLDNAEDTVLIAPPAWGGAAGGGAGSGGSSGGSGRSGGSGSGAAAAAPGVQAGGRSGRGGSWRAFVPQPCPPLQRLRGAARGAPPPQRPCLPPMRAPRWGS